MQQDPIEYEICIIGAGPAGLMAAIAAEAEGASVCIVEKNTNAGRKLLLTGGGRCNLTHSGGIDDFVRACFPYGHILKPAFYAWPPEQTLAFFHRHGLKTYQDEKGCIFPVSQRAGDVCRLLVDQVNRQGAAVQYARPVQGVKKTENGFAVMTESNRILCRAVIVATGGKSWPHTGSTGDGYSLAESFGHTVIRPAGILCPMVCREGWVADLQGLSLPRAAVRMKVKSKTMVFSGEIVFTADGIGGPIAFDVSRSAAERLAHQADVPVTLDFFPDIRREELSALLIERCAAHPKKEIAGLLCEWFPHRLSAFLRNQACGTKAVLACALPKPVRQKLVEAIQTMPLTLIRSGPLEKATVTRGGVRHQAIDSRTLQSRLCEGLFFAGEVIDVDGPCGGYNLQIAFSTGFLAGKSAAAGLHSP